MAKKTTRDETEIPKPSVNGNAPVSLTIDGHAYQLARLALPELSQFLLWVKAQRPDPLKQIAPYMADFDPANQQIMMKDALAEFRKPIRLNSEEFREAIATEAGVKEIVWMAMRKAGHPVTRAQTDAVVNHMSLMRMAEVIATAIFSGDDL